MDPPAEGADMMEEDPMMEKAEDDDEKETEGSEPEEEHEMCCCCICQCSTKETRDLSCCCCFPIKCGIICIGIITMFLTFGIFVELFYGFINEQIHWWYVVVGIVLIIPLII